MTITQICVPSSELWRPVFAMVVLPRMGPGKGHKKDNRFLCFHKDITEGERRSQNVYMNHYIDIDGTQAALDCGEQ